MSGKHIPFRYSTTPPPKETAKDRRERYEKSRGKLVEPLDKEPRKKQTSRSDVPTISSAISMAKIREVSLSEEECIQEELDNNKQLPSRTLMPIPGPSCNKGKQHAEPARDLMRDLNDSDPSSDNPPSEPDKPRKKKSCKKKPKDSDSDDWVAMVDEEEDAGSVDTVVVVWTPIVTLTLAKTESRRGTTLENFEPAVMANYPSQEETPLFLLHWEEFVYELKDNFGPVDTKEDAEEDLEDLKMGSNHHVTKYFISFAKYKARTKFNDRGYYHMVKNVLPNCILDDLAKIFPKPKTYESLRQVACRGPTTTNTSSSTNTANSSGSKSNNNKSWTPNNSKSKTTTVTVTNTSVPQNTHLGPDGRLTDTERKRHIDAGLCIVCGLKGHVAKDCNKARWNSQASGSSSNTNHPAAKARASNTEEKPNTDDKAKAKDSASGSKN
ncbi:hypothetical protein M422DRAFT_262508 [Sphaerobolus stellatus SS14]|uniref:CCHC-type domain-containing protein n=1 Tax=Sphaerobolus stellatus (strain SS14) TaxID=990650 RepID=A0A0C9TXY4_SPHS4|nr:hypothetical protein M422DRAFT_262508 [Sphaerobolus stellatus SS14]